MLNHQQASIVYGSPQNTVVFAAPGSGKTTVLTQHILHLVCSNEIRPTEVMAMTFSRESALEMRNRLRASADEGLRFEAVRIGTFHAQIFRVLLESRPDIPVLLSEQERMQLMQTVLQSLGEFDSNSVRRWLNVASTAKSTWPMLRSRGKAARILEKYEKLKVRHGRWDFDDILVHFCLELESNPTILTPLRSLKYLLVDEFQDTNSIQWAIVKLISTAVQIPVFVVGDDDQAIYGFRGASPEWLLKYEHVYPACIRHELSINHRSDQCIVFHSQKLILHNENRAPKVISAASSNLGTCMSLSWSDETQEALQIAKLLESTRELPGPTSQDFPVPSRTIAILARTRQQLYQLATVIRRGTRQRLEFRTFHDAKGKEWDEVHILGAVSPNPHLAESDAEAVNTEEERRLFYVAMTRARHRLFIHSTRKANGVRVAPSRFIEEAGLEVLSHCPTRGVWRLPRALTGSQPKQSRVDAR